MKMKKNFSRFGGLALASLFAIAALAGCRKDDPEQVVPPADYETIDAIEADSKASPRGMYLLNEGNMGSNKSSIDYLDYRNAWYGRNLFAEKNPEITDGLGDVGNDIQVYKNKLFVVVNGSHKVEILDASSLVRIAKVDVPNCRFIRFDGNYAYVTSYVAKDAASVADQLGALYKIDLKTYTVVSTATVGYQPEQFVISDGKAYVANSGGYHSGYDSTVSVVDLETMKVDYTVDVAPNLSKMEIDQYGNIWVSSNGNYYDIASDLYELVQKDGKYAVSKNVGCGVSGMALYNDKLYTYNSTFSYETYTSTYSYAVVDVKTGTYTDGIITDGTESNLTAPYCIAVNPSNGDIMITDAKNYTSSGELHCYSNDGKHKWSVRTGDIPGHVVFVK